jgi:hypothetical protein
MTGIKKSHGSTEPYQLSRKHLKFDIKAWMERRRAQGKPVTADSPTYSLTGKRRKLRQGR